MILGGTILFGLIAVFSLMSCPAMAQSKTQQLWLTYNHQARISQKWGYQFDANHRTFDFNEFQSAITAARVGVSYFFRQQARITAGYAWFGTHLHGSDKNLLVENRLWQQILWLKRNRSTAISHRIRLEERFRETGSNSESITLFTTRLRYMVQIQTPIITAKSPNAFILYAQAANEIMLHAGQGIGNRLFDQNRAIAGIVLSPNRQLELALLYQYIAQYQPSIQQINHTHSIRVTLLHQLDFRKK